MNTYTRQVALLYRTGESCAVDLVRCSSRRSPRPIVVSSVPRSLLIIHHHAHHRMQCYSHQLLQVFVDIRGQLRNSCAGDDAGGRCPRFTVTLTNLLNMMGLSSTWRLVCPIFHTMIATDSGGERYEIRIGASDSSDKGEVAVTGMGPTKPPSRGSFSRSACRTTPADGVEEMT